MKRWHPIAWLIALEMVAITLLSASDFNAAMYARPISLFTGVPVLWPAFRLLTERRSAVVATGVAALSSAAWLVGGMCIYPTGGWCATHEVAIWSMAGWVPLTNLAAFLGAAIVSVARAVRAA